MANDSQIEKIGVVCDIMSRISKLHTAQIQTHGDEDLEVTRHGFELGAQYTKKVIIKDLNSMIEEMIAEVYQGGEKKCS